MSLCQRWSSLPKLSGSTGSLGSHNLAKLGWQVGWPALGKPWFQPNTMGVPVTMGWDSSTSLWGKDLVAPPHPNGSSQKDGIQQVQVMDDPRQPQLPPRHGDWRQEAESGQDNVTTPTGHPHPWTPHVRGWSQSNLLGNHIHWPYLSAPVIIVKERVNPRGIFLTMARRRRTGTICPYFPMMRL